MPASKIFIQKVRHPLYKKTIIEGWRNEKREQEDGPLTLQGPAPVCLESTLKGPQLGPNPHLTNAGSSRLGGKLGDPSRPGGLPRFSSFSRQDRELGEGGDSCLG